MLTTLLYMLPVLLIGGLIAYVFSQQQKKATQDIDFDALRANKKQVSDEFLDRQLPYLKEWMRNGPVDAYTSATLPSNVGDFIKTAVKDQLRKSLTYSNRNTVETPAFFILSGKNLHFINTDQDGDLSEHIVFEENKLQNTQIKFAGSKKEMGLNLAAVTGQKHYPKVYDLTIESAKGKTTLQAIDRITNNSFANTNIKDMFKGFAVDMAKGKMASEYFFERLGELYPHLRVELEH